MYYEKKQPTADCIVARLTPNWGSRISLLFKATQPYEHYYDENGEEIPYGAIISWTDVELPPKESEDKRIGNLIYCIVRDRKDVRATLEVNGISVDKALAYLEKQKEPAPIPNKFNGLKSLMLQYLQSAANRKDDAEIESDTDLWGRKILDYVWKYDGNQEEQKHVESIKFSNEFENQVSHILASILNGEYEYNESFVKYAAQSLLGYARNELKTTEWSDDSVHTRFAFYTYRDELEVLYLSNVFVEESSRNNGLGTLILKAAEKVAETIGAKSIRLKVKRDSPVKVWYRKHGYSYIAFENEYDWLEKTLEYSKPVKQEWSDEDNRKLNRIYEILGYAADDKGFLTSKRIIGDKEAIELQDFLKSLHPQPKILSQFDWKQLSEKDTLGRNKCYIAVRDSEFSHEEKEWAFNFLKRCEPKSHWKPSEEQMEALMLAIEGKWDAIKPTGYMSRRLEDLYEGLANTFGVECNLEK